MSALNAAALTNAVGVYAVDVDVDRGGRKKKPNLSENHKLMEQSIEQETKRWMLDLLLYMVVT